MIQELLPVIRREYRLEPIEVKPCGPVWRISDPSGIYSLKRTDRSPGELTWLAMVINELLESGFSGLLPVLPAQSGHPFVIAAGKRYILSRWFEGNHPSFSDNYQRKTAVALYGRLHRAAAAVRSFPKPEIDNWLETYRERTNFLENLRDSLARRAINRVDRAIQKQIAYYLVQARLTLSGLSASGFEGWQVETDQYGFCHNDPAPRNIIMARQWVLIDYELSGCGVFVRELATLSQRILKLNQWNRRIFDELIAHYSSIRSLSAQELSFLVHMMVFPQSFWRICSQRFQERLAWSERRFAGRLWEIAAEEPKRLTFLAELLPELKELAGRCPGGME
jgi:CotS family spore coat protein